MRNRALYLKPNSTPTEIIRFMISTYDGRFVILTSIIYILWGIGAGLNIIQINWIGIWGAFLLPVLMLVIYLSDRLNTCNHNKTAAFYCFTSEIFTAGIPFYRELGDLL